jgi:hypothetical protein
MGLRSGNASGANYYGLAFPSMNTEDPYAKAPVVAGAELEEASQKAPEAAAAYTPGQLAAKGATQAMNAGGTMGQTATSAGLMMGLGSIGAGAGTAAAAAGPVGWGVAAGGLALSAYEQSQKAEAMNEQARVQEAQQRKADVQTALNQALGATRQLGV